MLRLEVLISGPVGVEKRLELHQIIIGLSSEPVCSTHLGLTDMIQYPSQ